jgi:hypothetical protein
MRYCSDEPDCKGCVVDNITVQMMTDKVPVTAGRVVTPWHLQCPTRFGRVADASMAGGGWRPLVEC